MSATAQPRPSRLRPPSIVNAAGSASRTGAENPPNESKKDETMSKKKIGFQLPPLSVIGKKKELDFEQIRKKVMRRDNPEGEDKKKLAGVLKHLRENKTKVRVQEVVNLLGRYTSDNGETMRRVMEEDLAIFRRMVTKVYENMTQDVSDVLVNEQLQATNFYQERYDMFNAKMLWMVSEIFQMIPDFDFEKYAKNKDEFLNYICPIPALTKHDDDTLAMQKRQEAFHRLQWLKVEEGRLAEENKRLEARLEELKKQHKKETTQASMKSAIMEQKTLELEEEEQEKQEHLNELEGVLGKNIVRTEAYVRLEQDEMIRVTKPLPREEPTTQRPKHLRKKDDWSVSTAVDIEEMATRKMVEGESARADEKKRIRRKTREPDKETSLFCEPQPADYPELPSARPVQERVIQRTTATVHEKRPPRPQARCGGGC